MHHPKPIQKGKEIYTSLLMRLIDTRAETHFYSTQMILASL